MKKIYDNEGSLRNVAEWAKSVKKPCLEEKRAEFLKSHLLSQIELPETERTSFSLSPLISYIRGLIGLASLDVVAKAKLRENILSFAENNRQRSFFWHRFFVFNKRFVSACLLLFMVFGMFSFLQVDNRVVRAETFTFLENFDGKVEIVRGGNKIETESGMRLFEDDKILTGENGFATVNYFDDGVSRLSSDTEVVLKRLFKDNEDSFDSYVEVSLLDGAIWSKMVNLIGEDSSFIVQVESLGLSAKARKAAFNVELRDEQVEVGVFNSSVNLEQGENNSKLLSGKKALIQNENLRVVKIDENEKKMQWIASNLESDKQFLREVDKRLLAARMETMNINFDEKFDLKTSFWEDVRDGFTFDGVEKKKNKLNQAEKSFVEAQVKLYDPDLSEEEKANAERAMQSFYEEVESFNLYIKEVEQVDEAYGKELKSYLQKKVLAQKKDLNTLLPDSPLYGVKEDVENLELSVNDDKSKRLVIKKDKLLSRLSEAQELFDLGKEEKAKKLLENYEREVFELSQEVRGSEIEEALKVAIITEIMDSKSEYQSVISPFLIEKVLPFDESDKSDEQNESPMSIKLPPVSEIGEKYGVIVEGDKALSPLLAE